MQVLIFPKFIATDFCDQLNDWVDLAAQNKWIDKGLDRENFEYSNRLTSRMYADRYVYPPVVYEVSNKISEFLDIKDLKHSTAGGGRDGIVVSCTFPDGDVYSHTDPMEGNLHVLRCNIMTRGSNAGGNLYIGGNKIDIGVGDLHCYLPSYMPHHVTKVEGNTSRVLWMFGYQCFSERFNQIAKQNLNAKQCLTR